VTTPPENLAREDGHARQGVVVDPTAVRAQRRQDNLERFERITALPLLVLAIAFIPLLVLPLLFELPEPLDDAFLALDWFIWAAFAAEFITRLTLSSKKWRFVRHNWAA
jgi:voltage-gated potassium channel